MSNYNCFQKGIQHAPGVLCLVVGIPASKWAFSKNNGKTVTLVELAVPAKLYSCGCGLLGRVDFTMSRKIWIVNGPSIVCSGTTEGKTGAFPQHNLIPIAGPGIDAAEWDNALLYLKTNKGLEPFFFRNQFKSVPFEFQKFDKI